MERSALVLDAHYVIGGIAVILLDQIRAVPAVEDAKDPQVAAVPVAHQETLIVFFYKKKE